MLTSNRGIGNYLVKRVDELPAHINNPHIFCSSGGNAGLAAVHASRTLGIPCTVVVPSTVKQLMVTKIRAAGAYEVLQHGDAWADADKFMREELMPQVRRAITFLISFLPRHMRKSSPDEENTGR